MKKRLLSIVTKSIFIIFALSTIISTSIVYKDVENKIAMRFVIGYVIFTFFLLFYIFFIIILNLRKLKGIKIRKRIIRFIIIFLVIGTINCGFNYIFRPSEITLAKDFSSVFGLAIGISFFDLIFFKDKKNETA